jgi:hypothetical protein
MLSLTAIVCSGCATTERMNIHDLSTFKIDCSNKEAQIRFLRTQIPTSNDRLAAAIDINIFSEAGAAMKGEMSQHRLIKEGYYESAAKGKIWELESQCPNKTVYDYEDMYNRDWHGKEFVVHDLNEGRR